MKSLLIFTLSVIPLIGLSQYKMSWSDILVVNDNVSMGYSRPRIALTSANVPLVMWGKKDNLAVYTSRLNNNVFENPVKITPNGVTAFVQDWAGPELATFGDIAYVTFKAQPENSGMIYIVKSVNGGITYSDTVRVSDNNWTRFPNVAVDTDGNPYLSFMDFDSNFTKPHYSVASSSDGGLTFLPVVNGSGLAPGEVCDCCPSFITVSTNRISLLFRNNDNNLRDLWASVSMTSALNFNLASDIDANNWMMNVCPSSGPDAVDLGDSMVYVWMSGAGGAPRVNLGTASFSNLTIGLNVHPDEPVAFNTSQNVPRIAGIGDTLGIVWQEIYQGKSIIKSVFSISGPLGLLDGEIDTVSASVANNQKNPDIAFAGGDFHITWQDENNKRVLYRKMSISDTSGSGVSGIGDMDFAIYPVPPDRKMIVEVPLSFLNGEVIIYDISGNSVFSKRIRERKTEITDPVPGNGTYVLEIKKDGQILRKKFIK